MTAPPTPLNTVVQSKLLIFNSWHRQILNVGCYSEYNVRQFRRALESYYKLLKKKALDLQ
jgi:hypothetical protein